jgi:hypothetical protein
MSAQGEPCFSTTTDAIYVPLCLSRFDHWFTLQGVTRWQHLTDLSFNRCWPTELELDTIFVFRKSLVADPGVVWVCGCSLAGITGSNPTGCMDVCLYVIVVCCQVDVCATGRSLSPETHHTPTECGVSN